MDYWNNLIKVRNNIDRKLSSKNITDAKRSELTYISKLAESHLNSMNTAGGKHIIKNGLENFFINYGYLNK